MLNDLNTVVDDMIDMISLLQMILMIC